MSAQSKRVTAVAHRIRGLYEKQKSERDPWKRRWYWLKRWALMLYHEFLRDDVKVRAESLAFLMIFSLLPLIAGAFFIFTIFAQFGFVQDAVTGFVEEFLLNIPAVHREFVRDYVLKFKDAYLASLNEKSGSMGIFALFILIYVGLQTFGNVDRTLNHIWGSDRHRPFFEQVRNFLVVVVAAPLVLVSGLSIPLILRKLSAAQYVFDALPFLVVLLNGIITPGLFLITFFALYRFIPVRHVKWKPALAGAVFALVCFLVANWVLRLYFLYGTQSAYGKAAIVPLIGLWIYIIWIVVIMGAEVSYLMQNEKDFMYASDIDPTLKEGGALLALLSRLYDNLHDGKGAANFESLRACTGLPTSRLHMILNYLHQKKIIVECVSPDDEGAYVLAKEPDVIEISTIMKDFFREASQLPPHDMERQWKESLEHWLESFGGATLASAVASPVRKKGKRLETP